MRESWTKVETENDGGGEAPLTPSPAIFVRFSFHSAVTDCETKKKLKHTKTASYAVYARMRKWAAKKRGGKEGL